MLRLATRSRANPRSATWFLTTAAGFSTLLCPPAARAFVQLQGAAFAPCSPFFSSLHQRPSQCERAKPHSVTCNPVPAGQVSAWPCPSLRGTRQLSVTRAEATDTNPPPPAEEEVDPGVVEGTDLRVLKYPHPALRAHDEEVTEFGADLKKTVKEMFLVMYASKGVGLAAPQVGINKRIMVFNPEGDKRKWLAEVSLINPKIVETSEATDVEDEACLSFPDMLGKVRRHKWIKIEAQNADGKPIKKKYMGWTARVFQHEYDHLEGTVYVDRLDDAQDVEAVKPKLAQLAKTFKEETGHDGAPELKFEL